MKNKEPIFVIGFPKSGNTWLARLLAEVTRSNIAVNDPLDVINAADNSPERTGCYVVYKEHVVNDVEEALRGKVVYIIRDVRDVLISGFYHCNRWCNNELIKRNIICRWYFIHEVGKLNKMWQGNAWAETLYKVRCSIKFLIGYKYNKVRIGSWSDHVSFWAGKPGVIIVRYEDLLRDTKGEMRKLLDAFEMDVSDEILSQAISNQSFENKKALFQQSGDSRNAKFLRSGEAGGWRELLSPSMVKKIEMQHGRVMNEYGYKSVHCEGEK